jgi:hypothetical protein
MSDVLVWIKAFRRSVPRLEREAILRQHRNLDDVVAQIGAVPAAHRSTLYLPALWTMAAKCLEAPDASTPAKREQLLKHLSELCAMPYRQVVGNMAEMVKKLDADHKKWKRRARHVYCGTDRGHRTGLRRAQEARSVR